MQTQGKVGLCIRELALKFSHPLHRQKYIHAASTQVQAFENMYSVNCLNFRISASAQRGKR